MPGIDLHADIGDQYRRIAVRSANRMMCVGRERACDLDQGLAIIAARIGISVDGQISGRVIGIGVDQQRNADIRGVSGDNGGDIGAACGSPAVIGERGRKHTVVDRHQPVCVQSLSDVQVVGIGGADCVGVHELKEHVPGGQKDATAYPNQCAGIVVCGTIALSVDGRCGQGGFQGCVACDDLLGQKALLRSVSPICSHKLESNFERVWLVRN